jgi:hypothetical protein
MGRKYGNVATLEAAKQAFRAAWDSQTEGAQKKLGVA